MLKRIGPNKWRVDWRDENEVRRQKTFEGPLAQTDAEDFWLPEKRRVQRCKAGLPTSKKIPYKEFKDQWLKDFKIKAESRNKLNTYDDYVSIFAKHLDPLFISCENLNDLKPIFIKRLRVLLEGKEYIIKKKISKTETIEVTKRLSPKTIRNILTPLNTLLHDAYIAEATDKDLSVYIDKPSAKTTKAKFPLTEEEVERFIDALPQNEPLESAVWKLFFALAFYSGMRTGELIGLQFDDFDLSRNKIHIRRSFSRGKLTSPKGGDVRVIDLIPESRRHFINWRHARSKYLFCTDEGKVLDRNNIRNRIWAKTLTKIGLAYRTLYHTRHTFASIMMRRGEDPLWIAMMMGDNVQTVWKHYAIYRDPHASKLEEAQEQKA